MRITYDPDHDVMYIKFLDEKIVESVEIEEGVIIDYSENGKIVGIEIINASARVGSNPLSEISIRLQEATV